MPKKPIGICLIGLGRAGRFHLQSLRLLDDAKLACVYDLAGDECTVVAAQTGCALANSAEEAIARSEVDAIIVATPTDSHFEFVQMGLDARKPVLTEKPLGRHLHQIDKSFEKAAKNESPLFVAFQRRFDPAFASLVSSVRNGSVGQLQFVRSVSRDNPVPSLDYLGISGGIFHDCMVHDLDMVVQIVGETPTHLSSFGTSFISEIGDLDDFDNVVASLLFPSGITATIDINRKSVYGYDQRIEAFGDRGMVQAENYHNTSVKTATESGFQQPPVDYSFPTRYRDAYLEELKCFVECVRGETSVPISHEDVRINHLLACGLETAAREKRVVCFNEIEGNLQ
ncbi:MAG: Gfo/Idh/MocA family oxidoreductase [Planctomycetales bacterium]|nr:Gfo/Idh/MocA family oxidoreductase [Planctomycetales bacterium]